MEYPNITALVPQGEHFDASAMNEGIWVSQTHFDAIETKLTNGAIAINTHAVDIVEANLKVTEANDQLAAANQTIADRDATIASQAEEIADLKKKAAHPISTTTTTQPDKLNDGASEQISEVTKEAQRLFEIKSKQ
jgi:hypothetical protein